MRTASLPVKRTSSVGPGVGADPPRSWDEGLPGSAYGSAHPVDDERDVTKVLPHHDEPLQTHAPEVVVPADIHPVAAPGTVLGSVVLAEDGELLAEEVRLAEVAARVVGNRPVHPRSR